MRVTNRNSYILIFVCSIALYANSLQNGFVYDDNLTIVDNLFIKDIGNLKYLFEKSYFASGEDTYRPAVTATYIFDYTIWGLNPIGYHLTNILFHSLNSILIYIFFNRIGIFSLIPTFLFISHPALTEAVNGVSFREDLLAFSFYFISLIFYIRVSEKELFRSVSYIASCFAFFLALLSKEMAATLPLVLVLIDLYIDGYIKRPWKYAGYILILLLYVYLRFSLFYKPKGIEAEFFLDRLLQIPACLGQFTRLLFFPINLSVEYPKQINQYWLYVFGIFVLGLSLFALIQKDKKRNLSVLGLLWMVITLVPVYNIVPILNPVAERYLYLPAVGATIVLSNLLNKQVKGYKVVLIGFITASYVVLAILRNPVWKDNYTLWIDAAKKVSTYRVYFQLGKAYTKMERFDDAAIFYQKSLEVNPIQVEAIVNLGIVYYMKGDFDLAITNFKRSLEINYYYATVHYMLGRCYFNKGQVDKAMVEYKEAVRIEPGFEQAKESLQRLTDF